ncbi:MAG TPA: methyltransferase dimerization domain-containing protein, partial [Vicinamibacterales bacterium]|nr:methyltransferase dimerization domain-containing protein [Vicinamibacterales bacterium]
SAAPALPADAQVLRLILGSLVSRALGVAAELGIADLLKDGPMSSRDLAMRTGSNPDALYRTLRALAGVGVFEARADRSFANNELSTALRADVPRSVRANALWFNDISGWTAWGRFDHSVRTGKPAFEEVFGTDCFTWLRGHPSSFDVFQQTMTELSAASGNAVAEAYDFSSVRKLVDVVLLPQLAPPRGLRPSRVNGFRRCGGAILPQIRARRAARLRADGEDGVGCSSSFLCRSSRGCSRSFGGACCSTADRYRVSAWTSRAPGSWPGLANRARSVPRSCCRRLRVAACNDVASGARHRSCALEGEPGQLPGAREVHVIIALSATSVGSAPR